MNKGWQTKADVLKDLGEVNGRRTGAEHLDSHVVEGERPPPILHETPDEDEMNYFSGGHAAPGADAGAGPDLAGISTMLQMVNDMDETVDNVPVTLYHNRNTDEINISKLNPNAGVYVPGGSYNTNNVPKHSPKKNNNRIKSRRSPGTPDKENNVVENSMKNAHNGNYVLPKFSNNNMFKSKNVKEIKERDMNNEEEESHVLPTFSYSMFKSKSDKNIQEGDMSKDKNGSPVLNETSNPNAQNIQREAKKEPALTTKPNLLANGLPKRQIETTTTQSPKAEEIKEIQNKIKSSIISSSKHTSLENKRQKNVAIATLLKLGMLHQTEKPVKLVKPEYFEKPPTNDDIKEVPGEQKLDKDVPSTSSSESNVNQIDPESIHKVNGWFSSIESPKQKPQLLEPLVLKDCVTFKKKTTSSITSRNSSNKEKEEPKDRETKSFKPSAYANDLLKKFETNAQKQALLNEDWGTRLERQLKEKDEIVKQNMLARQNAG